VISVSINGCNLIIEPPENWKPEYGECNSLYLRREDLNGVPVLLSAWKPSAVELEMLVRGGSVVLGVLGTAHPPVLMYASTDE
jgi:hypothetical protein